MGARPRRAAGLCGERSNVPRDSAGLYGAVFASEAKKAQKSVLIIEKRDHIAGNIYTELDEGIHVHKYGAHIFHTNDRKVWDYITKFAEFNRYTNSPVANYKGEIYNLPFNMNTFNKMWGVITPDEARAKIEEQKKEALSKLDGEPSNLEEQAISLIGTDIYEKLIKGYTQKQWGRKCTDLPAFIIKRLPVRFIYDNNYFNALFQGIPVGGYTKLVKNIIGDIPVKTGVDYLALYEAAKQGKAAELGVDVDKDLLAKCPETLGIAKKVVYTGPVDAFFGYSLGALQYRSVRFETQTLEMDNYQGNAVVNYTDAETPYTRIIEHKHFEFAKRYKADGSEMSEEECEKDQKTIISKEYSAEWKQGDEPYYPVNDDVNGALYQRYKELADKMENVIFGGRLGEYKYYDMDVVIGVALERAASEVGIKS